MIEINRPFLPPQEEYLQLLSEAWDRGWLTNQGPIAESLEAKLADHLGIDHMALVSNGTVAIQMAIKLLGVKGKVITTPFSFVATASSTVWEGCQPVFADIDKHTWNVDPNSVESLIDEETTAILATHVFGIPCDVERLEQIAHNHGLSIIYDAAHAFGVKIEGRSVFEYGDISTVSFHATKLFHTVEGGGMAIRDVEKRSALRYMRNFGIKGPYEFDGLGINGKNSELHAAMGLVNLRYVGAVIKKRKTDYETYLKGLEPLNYFQFQEIPEGVEHNFGYMPLLFQSESDLEFVFEYLKQKGIHGRRYFYPTLDALPYLENAQIPVAKDVASRVMCLPHYFDLSKEEGLLVINTLKEALNNLK